MRTAPTGVIDTVAQPLEPDVARQVSELAARDDAARAGHSSEFDEVICLLRADDGEVAGAAWARPDDVALIGGRRLWMYASALGPGHEESGAALLEHAFAALEARFDPDERGPIGVCVVLYDPAEMARRPEAAWADPLMVYAGYESDGGQVRVGYFPGALI